MLSGSSTHPACDREASSEKMWQSCGVACPFDADLGIEKVHSKLIKGLSIRLSQTDKGFQRGSKKTL